MTQWEYYRALAGWNGYEWLIDGESTITIMDRLGLDGWELVSTDYVSHKGVDTIYLWFKRPRSQPPTSQRGSRSSW